MDERPNRLAVPGQVASELMHDVNGALAVIAASAEYLAMLADEERRGPEYEAAIEDILGAVQRAAVVSHRLLGHTRGEDITPLAPPAIHRGGDAARPSLARSRVMLVEDDVAVRRGVARLLAREGAVVETAGSGRQAVDRLTRPPDVDLVVLDSDLPDGDGRWVLRTLAQLGWCGAPVLGISGHKSGEVLLEAGAHTFLAKPFTRADLIRACERLLASATTGPASRERR